MEIESNSLFAEKEIKSTTALKCIIYHVICIQAIIRQAKLKVMNTENKMSCNVLLMKLRHLGNHKHNEDKIEKWFGHAAYSLSYRCEYEM